MFNGGRYEKAGPFKCRQSISCFRNIILLSAHKFYNAANLVVFAKTALYRTAWEVSVSWRLSWFITEITKVQRQWWPIWYWWGWWWLKRRIYHLQSIIINSNHGCNISWHYYEKELVIPDLHISISLYLKFRPILHRKQLLSEHEAVIGAVAYHWYCIIIFTSNYSCVIQNDLLLNRQSNNCPVFLYIEHANLFKLCLLCWYQNLSCHNYI